MKWELEYEGQRQSLADWGLANVKRTLLNQGRDRVTFSQIAPRALTELPLFEAFRTIRIYRDGTLWFQGVVTEIPAFGGRSQELKQFKVCGPWWQLENIIYQQLWNLAADPTQATGEMIPQYKSHLVLGQAFGGLSLSIDQQLGDVLNYAVNAGAPLQYSPFDFPQCTPFDECKDLSCAEAIQRILRWVPDAVVWFDYTTAIPTFHIQRRAQLSKVQFGLSDGIKSLQISPRYDLQLQGVAIKYERSHSNSGSVWKTLEIDRFPANIEENQPRLLILTVELEGSRSHYIKQKIETESIYHESVSWWKDHLPALADVPLENIQLISSSRQCELPRELIRGGVADWMHVAVESDVIRAKISYHSENCTVSQQDVAIKLKATDASTRVYSQLSSFLSEEASPRGLAKMIYESFQHITFEGTIELEQREVFPLQLGQQLNIGDGPNSWENMNALIQESVEEVDVGLVRLRFGSAAHLGLRDLIRLTRVNRGREAPRSSYVRLQGQGSDSEIEQPSDSAAQNTHVGQTAYGKMTFSNPEDGTQKIILDASQIAQSGLVMQPRPEDVCENGILKKRLALASQPFAV